MMKIIVENVTEPKHRIILNEFFNGEFSYVPNGGPIDEETFELEFGLGEYAVVRDEILDKKHEELMEDGEEGYSDIHDAFPQTVTVERGDVFTVSL